MRGLQLLVAFAVLNALPLASEKTAPSSPNAADELMVHAWQKSCLITRRSSDDSYDCKNTWSVIEEDEERVGEGSTCIFGAGDALQKYRCEDGKWIRAAHHRHKRGCPSDLTFIGLPGATCAVVKWDKPDDIDHHDGANPGDCVTSGDHTVKYEFGGFWFTDWGGDSCSFKIHIKLQCHSLPTFHNGRRSCSGGSTGDYGEGSTCRFSCYSGFRLEGSSSTWCRKSGSSMTWTNSAVPYCRGQCSSLPTFNNGARNCIDGFYESSACTHTCNGGYRLSGSSVTRCTKRSTSTFTWDKTEPNCLELCAWQTSHCWPGDCSQHLASNCRCRTGFRNVTVDGHQRCELDTPPNLSTCRVALRDSQGNSKNSTTSGNSTNCTSQQDEWINTQPTELFFAIKADLKMSLGTHPQYVADSKVGIVGASITLVKVSVTGSETTAHHTGLQGPQYCQRAVSDTRPVFGEVVHDCEATIAIPPINLQNGERLCADMETLSGGFYQLQNNSYQSQGSPFTFQPVSKKERVCFLFDGTPPAHCSSNSPPCTSQPLLLSTRLTRQLGIGVHVEGWLDPHPSNIQQKAASQIAKYRLELHEVDVNGSSLTVQAAGMANRSKEWAADVSSPGGPYDVDLTLPAQSASRLYAVLLEVHDYAGNVGYARRLVLYDNSSTAELRSTSSASLTATSADQRTNFMWQTNVQTKLCVSWRDQFYNTEMVKNNWLLPVASDTAREISGRYDQTSGLLPVQGTDNAGGITDFEVTVELEQTSGLSSFTKAGDLHVQSMCFNNSLADGQTYHITVRATDIMSNAKEDNVTVRIDHTGPSVNIIGLRGRRDGLYVHNTTNLSAMRLLLRALDPHSGIHTLTWALGTRYGLSDVGNGAEAVKRLNTTDCALQEHCYCPIIGECEVYAYTVLFKNLADSSIQGQHHREYYLTVNVTNQAALRTTQRMDILVDQSPPTPGVVLEGPGGDDQAETDFTSSDRVHVHWHGFQDHESGVMLYRVALTDRCLTAEDMETEQNITEVELGNSVTLQFPHEGTFYTTVVAYNGAMEPSTPACSDGVTYDSTPPSLLNVSLTHAQRSRAIACTHNNESWLINRNLTRTRLTRTDECARFCVKYQAVRVVHLPIALNSSLEEEVSTDLCSRLPAAKEASASFAAGEHKQFIVLPSDFLRLSWVGYDEESQMEEYYVGIGTDSTTADAPDLLTFTPTERHSLYHVRHSGLGHGDLFYIFLRAVSKAGLEVKVTLGPVIIDVTAPQVTESMTAVVEEGYVMAQWTNKTFVDPEQPDGMDFEITYRLGYTEQFVTPFLTLPESAQNHCKNVTIAGCARYPVRALQPFDTEAGRSFFFQLHVTSAAGHVTTINTSSVMLPPEFPPSHATVWDVVQLTKTFVPKSTTATTVDSVTPTPSFTSPTFEDQSIPPGENATTLPFFRSSAFDNATTTDLPNTDTVQVPSAQQTEEYFPAFSSDVSLVSEGSEICIAWHGFYRTEDLTIETGIGTTKHIDDVVAFAPAGNGSSFDKRNPLQASFQRVWFDETGERHSPVCYNTSSLPLYTKLYSLVRATDAGGTTVVSSDGFTVLPTDDPQNKLKVFSGKGCGKTDVLGSVVSSQNTTLALTDIAEVPIHTGDILFVRFTPFASDIVFHDAVLFDETLQGYQIIVKSPNASVEVHSRVPQNLNSGNSPTGQLGNTTIEILNCIKDTLLQPPATDYITVSWEMSGPWADLVKKLKVTVTDETCMETLPKKDKYKQLHCRLAEKMVSSSSNKVDFHGEHVFPGHAYRPSVAVCLDDDCLEAVQAEHTLLVAEQPSLTYDLAVVNSRSSDSAQVEFSASVDPPFSPSSSVSSAPCSFLWTLSADRFGSRPVSDWRLEQAQNCFSQKVGDTIHIKKATGTLYVCVQDMYPWRTATPSCQKLDHLSASQTTEIFNVIELSHSTFRHTNFDRYLNSRHLGNRFRDLLDLELDFAESSTGLAAIVTGGGEREVQWFLMRDKQSVPVDGDCAGDPQCQFTRTTNNGKVIFPVDKARLQDGQVYYLCATVAPTGSDVLQGRQGTGVGVCGDGVVTDDRPPTAGSVSIHSGHTGYLANSGQILVTWSGFTDVEDTLPALKNHVVLNYSVALGSYEGAEDIAEFVAVGQRTTWTFTHLIISTGSFCFATVKAEDRVGHVTQAWSSVVVIDATPPVVRLLTVGTLTQRKYVSGRDLNVRWENVEDVESGIVSIEVGVMETTGQEVMPFRTSEGSSSLMLNATQLLDGHSYVAFLKVTNGAGLTTLAQSEPFIVDSSPPSPGKIFNSASNTTDHDSYSTEVGTYSVYWSGFSDSHSGLDYYRVGLGTEPGQTDVESFVFVGRQNTFTWRRGLDQGKRYYTTLEACNRAGLCHRTSTGSITFDNSPPLAGSVTVGLDGRHSRFLGHNSSLPVQWVGFSDPQTGIHDFSWCVGTASGSCDVIPATRTLLSRAAVKAGLSLPVNTPLFVSVTARNPLGMTAVGVSDSFVVDPTPPEVVTEPYFVNTQDGGRAASSQWDRSVLRLVWEFRDPDSAVDSYTVNIRSQRTGRLVIDPVTVIAENGITLTLDKDHLLTDGDRHWAAVTACNAAHLCTSRTSSLLLIDSTPPTLGTLRSPLAWTRKTSANSGTVATFVSVTWQDFSDAESGITRYFLTVGTSYNADDLSGGKVTIRHDNTTKIQQSTVEVDRQFSSGDRLFMQIWAENSVGLSSPISRMEFEVLFDDATGTAGTLVSVRHSCGAAYCTGECACAAAGESCQTTTCHDLDPSDPSLQGLDVSLHVGSASEAYEFTSSAKCLEGHWQLLDPQFLSNVSRFEVSFGHANTSSTEGLVFNAESQQIWHDVAKNTEAIFCLPGSQVLELDLQYEMRVRVWVSHDRSVTFTSNPVTVDYSAPGIARAGVVLESTDGCTNDADFVTTQPEFTACWKKVFREQGSRITRYDVWVGTSPQADDIISPTSVGLNANFSVPTAGLREGTRYYVTVRAVNSMGLMTSATSDGITVDVTAPVPGVVFSSDKHTNRQAQWSSTSLRLSWHGFQDNESGVKSYQAAVYDIESPTTPMVPFRDVGFGTRFSFSGLQLQHKHSYFLAVKAQDAAGHESVSARSPSILIDTTPPEGVACQRYTLLDEQPMSHIQTGSFLFDAYHGEFQIHRLHKDDLVKVIVIATDLEPGAEGHIVYEELRMPFQFKYTKIGKASAEHILILPDSAADQSGTLSVVVEANPRAKLSVEAYRCDDIVSSDNDSVTIHQISEFAVSVCAHIRDEESQIQSMLVGIGTTPGGLQVQPLTPGSRSGHAVVEVQVQHGLPLYATVIALNHAGLRSRFISPPVTMDRTPPEITEVKVTPRYEGEGRENDTDVWVDAEWKATDAESGVAVCLCHLEGQSTYDTSLQETSEVSPGRCEWQLREAAHGSHVRVTVSCVNGVQMHATATSESANILLKSPDITEVIVISLPNDALLSPYDGPDPVFRSSKASLTFCWTGADDPTISHVHYRFLHESAAVAEWSPLDAYKTCAVLDHVTPRLSYPVITAQVRAINARNITSDLVSATVKLDDSSPILTGHSASAALRDGELQLDWQRVFQVSRDVTYAVYAGTAEGYGDLINHVITKDSSFKGYGKADGLEVVFVTIQAAYSNGHSNVYQAQLTL